jgi:pimeloyl-ACP methyl ester carboxylesterase
LKIETGTFLSRIPYARVGTQPRPILVLSGGQASVQRPTPARVSRDAARIARILPPRRSFIVLGYAPSASESYRLETIVADVAAIIGELGVPVQLVGISYGGVVALQVAANHPHLLSELVLVVSAYDFSPEGRRHVQYQIDCASRGDFAALVEGFAAVFRLPWLNWLLRLRLRARRSRLADTMNDPALIIRGLRALLDAPLADTAHLRRITARTPSLEARRISSSATACSNKPRRSCRTRRSRCSQARPTWFRSSARVRPPPRCARS